MMEKIQNITESFVMKFTVINTETGKLVKPYNYHFVIKQDGELWTINHDGSFTKADAKYMVVIKIPDM